MTLKKKIALGSAILGVAFAAMTGTSALVQLRTERTSGDLHMMAIAAQNHLQADMMHDAIRSAVYRALYFGGRGDKANAQAAADEVGRYTAEMRAAITANRNLPLAEDIKRTLDDVARGLDGYEKQAKAIAGVDFADVDATARGLAGFDAAFIELAGVQERALAKISSRSDEVAQAMDQHNRISFWALLAASLTFLVILVWAARHLRSTVVAPVETLAGHLDRMTRGDFGQRIPLAVGSDEIASIQNAARAFHETGVAKAEADSAQHRVVSELAHHLDRLAGGDLSQKIETPFAASYEELRIAFNATVDRLATLIQQITSSARVVADGASEIRAASDDLARRNEQQAASLGTTSAAMNEVTRSVLASATSATEVQQSTAAAHREASDGNTVVRRAVEAMGEIERSSGSIAQIVDVIESIAFQTNLLALNAGVEAARAGDAGKGFAVVASEVRALAQRSAEAVKDIKELIASSTGEVSNGVTLVDQAGQVFTTIVGRVGEISAMVAKIAQETESQSQHLGQVNSAVGEMDRMTQQNAAMVEQSTAAARSLADQANELSSQVTQFALAGHTGSKRNAVAPISRKIALVPASHGNLAVKAQPSEDWSEF